MEVWPCERGGRTDGRSEQRLQQSSEKALVWQWEDSVPPLSEAL